jgi:hypothetical protein
LRNWLWNAVAEFATVRIEVNAERERDAETAEDRAFFARRTDFWHDVACYADGIDTWSRLRRSHRAAAPLMPAIEAPGIDEPIRLANPVIFILAILATLFVISMAMPFVLPRPGVHAAAVEARR